MKKRLINKLLSVSLVMVMAFFMLFNASVAFATGIEPTEDHVKNQRIDFNKTTYAVQVGTFSDWDTALERWNLASDEGWNPYMKYEKIGDTWHYGVWVLHATNYKIAEERFDELISTEKGAELYANGQLTICQYLCPQVEVVYERHNGEKPSTKVQIKGQSSTIFISAEIETNSGSHSVGKYLRYDVKFDRSKQGYQFEVICPENLKEAKEPSIIETATGLAEKWTFYLTDKVEETTTLNGTVIWKDENNLYERRPDSITVTLLANGEKVESKVVTAHDGWEFYFNNLPKYINGELVNYTIGMEHVKYYVSENNGANIIYTYDQSQETVTIQGTKTWVDEGYESNRPKSITVRLMANGEEVASKKVTKSDSWKYSFVGMPKYSDNGEKIRYSISEDSVSNYTTKVDGYNVINIYDKPEPDDDWKNETVTIKGTVTWNDEGYESNRPKSVTVRLMADGEEVASKKVTKSDSWKYSFTDVSKYTDKGDKIKYTITQDKVTDYKTKVKDYDITNTYEEPDDEWKNETITIKGTKIWNDTGYERKRPSSIKVRLKANGVEVASKKVTKSTDWMYTFTDVPKYSSNGKLIKYTVSEDKVSGYTTKIYGYNIQNTYEKMPVSDNPPTGDASIRWAFAIMAISATGIVMTLWTLKKKSKPHDKH